MTTRCDTVTDAELQADVVTYYEDGMWHTRRCDSAVPLASGSNRIRIIAIGAEVARWNGLCHIIRDVDGNIVESNSYVAGPYPSRSPVPPVRRRHRVG